MSSFTFEAKLISFSMAYDGITFYYGHDNDFYAFIAYNASSDQLQPICKGQSQFQNSPAPFPFADCKYVYRDYDEHDLYHQDHFDRTKMHYHVQFGSYLKKESMIKIVDQLALASILTAEEKVKCLDALHLRYQEVDDKLSQLITANPTNDLQAIQKYILSCYDNDILVHLHKTLLTQKFDYLRQLNIEDQEQHWQGCNAQNEVVQTSKAWAMIEKTIALQLANNMRTQCSVFTDSLGQNRCKHLSQDHRFFAIKRKSTNTNLNNNTALALLNAQEKKLQDKDQKMRKSLGM